VGISVGGWMHEEGVEYAAIPYTTHVCILAACTSQLQEGVVIKRALSCGRIPMYGTSST